MNAAKTAAITVGAPVGSANLVKLTRNQVGFVRTFPLFQRSSLPR